MITDPTPTPLDLDAESGFISAPCPEFYGRPVKIRVRERRLEYAEGAEGYQMPRSASIEEEALYEAVKESLTVARRLRTESPAPAAAPDSAYDLIAAVENKKMTAQAAIWRAYEIGRRGFDRVTTDSHAAWLGRHHADNSYSAAIEPLIDEATLDAWCDGYRVGKAAPAPTSEVMEAVAHPDDLGLIDREAENWGFKPAAAAAWRRVRALVDGRQNAAPGLDLQGAILDLKGLSLLLWDAHQDLGDWLRYAMAVRTGEEKRPPSEHGSRKSQAIHVRLCDAAIKLDEVIRFGLPASPQVSTPPAPPSKDLEQAWAEIRDTMADNMLNLAQKKVFVQSILKGQLANPPAPLTEGARPMKLEAFVFGGQLEIFRDSVLKAAVIPKGATGMDAKLKEEIAYRINAFEKGEVEDGPRPGGGEASPIAASPADLFSMGQIVDHAAERAEKAEARVKTLEDGLADALEGMEDMVGYVQEYFRKKWSHDDYIQRARMLLGLEPEPTERPAPGASPVPPVPPNQGE